MSKKLLSVLGVIIALIVWAISGQIGREIGKKAASSPSKPSQQEVKAKLIEGLKEAADQLTPQLPMMLDEDTRLDRSTIGPGARAVYHHTFPKYSSSDIDSNQLLTNLQPEIMSKVCASKDTKKFLQYGGIYVYIYSGNDGLEISRFEIDRNDCGFPLITP